MSSTTSCLTLVLTLSALLIGAPVLPAADRASGPVPVAQLISIDGMERTYHVRDRGGRSVTVQVPSSSLRDIRTSLNDDGTVHGTVVSIGQRLEWVRVQTQEDQMLTLAIAPTVLADMYIGEPLVLIVPHATRTSGLWALPSRDPQR